MAFTALDRPVQYLKGVGPKRAEALSRMGVHSARDLLYHVPRRYHDASTIHPIASLEIGQEAVAVGRVRSKGVIPTRSGLRIFQAVLEDDSGYVTCSWPGQPWLDRRIRVGDRLLVAGPVRHFHGRQIHPKEYTMLARAPRDGEGAPESRPSGPAEGTVFVAYPATEEVPQWVLRGIFDRNLDWLLEKVQGDEYLPDLGALPKGLPPLDRALSRLHRPGSAAEPESGRRRLAFDELFFLQVVQALARHRDTEAEPGIAFERTNALIKPLHDSLDFELTGAQARVLREIFADMGSGRRMNRFLQGDVGAGKTLVALFSMLLAAESGFQAALMAPTELLAEQHARKIQAMVDHAGLDVGVALLTGRLGASRRRGALVRIGSGEALLVVGTHALIQESVGFKRLGLVVVDEQHRFGVRQRMALVEGSDRGGSPDVLVMSATPIPRSLALTLYGDLDLSLLDEMPAGRTPVRTVLRYPREREKAYAEFEKELAAGHQGYIVFPLVEESEKSDLSAAVQEYERLAAEVFPDRRLGLLHGQLAGDEKERVMRAFRDGELDLIVATTVVEVGIDVPNATVMMVEHADRFGLSQLHQLRGRVGRGTAPSLCILVAEPGETARERLDVFTRTTDGFEIARADLRIRGQGDLFGAQQHGRDPLLRFADLSRDEDLLLEAREMARRIVASDPELSQPAHAGIRSALETRHAERLKMWRVG